MQFSTLMSILVEFCYDFLLSVVSRDFPLFSPAKASYSVRVEGPETNLGPNLHLIAMQLVFSFILLYFRLTPIHRTDENNENKR